MTGIDQLYLPGAVAMWAALVFLFAALWGYGGALREHPGRDRDVAFARRAYTCFALAVALASVVLAFSLITRDFRIEYVYQYSGLELPFHYQFAAFWAGQKGSFLIWLLWGALLGVPLYASAGRRHEASVMVVYSLTLLGLLFILVRESPFVMLAETPADGQGLNPLLQDDWMVIHPPIMFIGYAAAAIPFAFAMASLWRRDGLRSGPVADGAPAGDGAPAAAGSAGTPASSLTVEAGNDTWAARAFPWALGGFLVLGTAILMGGYWAYKTLGWGGFWGWDPVENASLIPWIFGTVLIHGLYLERTRGRFRRANYVFASLIYLAVLYGTFLTRSGVLADFSVHSFVDLGISGWLVGLMVFFFAVSVWLLATRLGRVPTRRNEDPFLSRGAAMVLGSITLLASALVITFGTSAPLLTGFLENPGQVGPEFYNRVNLPIALLLALLMSAVPFLTWRGTPPGRLARRLAPSFTAAVLITVVAAVLGVHSPLYLVYVFLAGLALSSNLHKTVEKARTGGLKTAGGYLAHVGVGVMLLGFLASSAYDESVKVTLPLGEPTAVGDLTFTFAGFKERTSPAEKEAMVVEVERSNGETFLVHPKLFRNQRTGQIMANPDIRTRPLSDLYVSPIEYDPGDASPAGQTLELAKGEEIEVGGYRVRFDGFDLGVEGNAMVAMTTGQPVVIGARLALARGGEPTSEDADDAIEVLPLYRLDQASGTVVTPPARLPGGLGAVVVAGINATEGKVRLAFQGPAFASATSEPPQLSVDVTRKPLIQLVWFGLYIVLAGGFLSTLLRLRQARRGDLTQRPSATA